MRRFAPVLVALVVLVSVTSIAATVSAAQTDVSIQSVETSVEQPAPGEPFTLTAEIANLQSSSGSVDVTDVFVRKDSSTSEYARIENVGSIAAGGSLSIPLTLSIDEPGETRLTVHVVVKDESGDHHRVNYPLYVDVQEPDEAVVSFTTPDLVAGQESTVDVTVSNGDDGTLSNVRLDLGGDARIKNPERVSAAIKSGTQTTHTYQATFPEAGEHTLNASLTYKMDQGSTRTVHRNVTVDVAAANVDTTLTAAARDVNGSPAIQTTLTEYGNVELRNVQVRAVADGDVVARALARNVPAEGSRTVTLDGSDIPAGSVTIVAQYTAAGERQTTETTMQYSPSETSDMALTGVETTRQGSMVTLSGDVANIGSADVSSVLVSVVGTDGVTPVAPNKEYFVGAVDSSEFSTFELTANASATADEVPVRIEYTVDGERLSRVVPVDISDGTNGSGTDDRSRSGGWLPGAILGGIVLLVLLGGIYRWRTR